MIWAMLCGQEKIKMAVKARDKIRFYRLSFGGLVGVVAELWCIVCIIHTDERPPGRSTCFESDATGTRQRKFQLSM